MNEEFLFDQSLLEELDFQQVANVFNPPITATNPGEHLIVRPLSTHDYDRGFMNLLSQLTDAGRPTRQQFLEKFKAMKSCPNTYFVTVIQDSRSGNIIGAATLFVEHKFIHGCSKRGHLEDVVVNNTYRGKQLGKFYNGKIYAIEYLHIKAIAAEVWLSSNPDTSVNTQVVERMWSIDNWKIKGHSLESYLIVVTVTLLAKHLGCYKMSLECKDKLIPFYTSLGFKLEPGNSNSMVQRFSSPS